MEKIFFYRDLSNQIFDKIRNYTKYFWQVKYRSPQAVLEQHKSLSKDFHVSVEVCTSNLSRDIWVNLQQVTRWLFRRSSLMSKKIIWILKT